MSFQRLEQFIQSNRMRTVIEGVKLLNKNSSHTPYHLNLTIFHEAYVLVYIRCVSDILNWENECSKAICFYGITVQLTMKRNKLTDDCFQL